MEEQRNVSRPFDLVKIDYSCSHVLIKSSSKCMYIVTPKLVRWENWSTIHLAGILLVSCRKFEVLVRTRQYIYEGCSALTSCIASNWIGFTGTVWSRSNLYYPWIWRGLVLWEHTTVYMYHAMSGMQLKEICVVPPLGYTCILVQAKHDKPSIMLVISDCSHDCHVDVAERWAGLNYWLLGAYIAY